MVAFNVSPLDKHVYPPEVEWEIDQNNKKQHLDLAKTIDANPLITGVILEHEYGIYGGEFGENILYFMERCKKPIIVTLHTVLPNPSPKMKEVTEKIIARANAVVVLTHNSIEVLENVYPMARGKAYVIPHGVHLVRFTTTEVARKKLKLGNRTILTTFGLLSRGKGIEYVIKALPAVIKVNPNILYLILGKTHPVVHRNEGESYRNELIALVNKLNLKRHVKFYDQYLNLKDLLVFLKATDVYISTSINVDQAVSGTLSYAMGTGRAIVSTAFAQSKEIITPEVGRLVPVKDFRAMSKALNEVLTDKKILKKMHKKAYEITRPMLWTNVAKQYTNLLSRNIIPPLNLDHLEKMTDKVGLFQFSLRDEPNKSFGYTLDDNARALILANQLGKTKLANIYLKFLKKCQQSDGGFINYIDYKGEVTEQNKAEDLEESNARAMWALGEIWEKNEEAKEMFLKGLDKFEDLKYLRPKALLIKSLITTHKLVNKDKLIKSYADSLAEEFKTNSTNSIWQWFLPTISYNNGVMPESLFLAGEYFDNSKYKEIAIKSLDFLIEVCFNDNFYCPVGNSKWYQLGEEKSEYDQQPEDPASMIIALSAAFKFTNDEKYKNLANKCFSWYLGNNNKQMAVYNFQTGGCYDGLTPSGVNKNQGAESTVSYLLAREVIEKLNKQ